VGELIAEWTSSGKRYRLVKFDASFELERCTRDVPNLEQWSTVLSTRGLRDAGQTRLLCEGIADLAGRLARLSESMNYAKGERMG
jgi:hypothetical protein